MYSPILFLIPVYLVLAIAIPMLLFAGPVWRRFRAPQRVQCPVTGGAANVEVRPMHAVLMRAAGDPVRRLCGCSLWPERAGCAQDCLVQIR